MDKHKDEIVGETSRRDFLKLMAVAGGGVAAAGAVGSAGAVEQEAPEEAPEKLGYRQTEHIRNYYDKADF